MSPTQSRVNPLLRPRSIAILGASPRSEAFSSSLARAVRSLGFGGAVHLVNPRYDRIGDAPCHPSLAAIPERPDCVLFAIGDDKLVPGLEAAAAAGVPSAVIFGRGYGSLPSGETITDAVAAIGRDAGMAICGANCMGYVNLVDRIQVTGMPFDHLGRATGVSLVSHSGSTWSGLVGNQRGIGFNFAVSAGQELVTDLGDYLDFLLSLDSTRVVACVVETLRDPEAFIEAADRADRRNIPVVVLRLGRSDLGKRFAVSHSGAISGSAAAYDAVFRQHNVVPAHSPDELLDLIELFAAERRPPVAGLALGTDSGGERQLIADIASDIGLGFASLSRETAQEVEALLSPGMEAANPLDYWGDGEDVMAPCLTALARDPGVGMVVMASNVPPGRAFAEQCVDAIIAVHRSTEKPVALMGNMATTMSRDVVARVRAAGLPVLMGAETGLRAVRKFLDYAHRPRCEATTGAAPAADGPAERWRQRLASAGVRSLSSADGFELLADYGIACAPFERIADEDQLIAFARRIGSAVVLKIDDPEIPHKSDVGGVRTGLADETAIRAGFAELRRRHPGAPLIAQQQAQGAELLLGMNRDRDFGPVITLGLGGVFTEVFRDAATLVPPVDAAAVVDALRTLKAFPILQGARGRPSADLGRIAECVVRFGRLSLDLGDLISEIEINPLLVGPDLAVAVDCLVVSHGETSE